jgi:hypothetical protein
MVSSQISLIKNIIAQVSPRNNGIRQKFFDKKPAAFLADHRILWEADVFAPIFLPETGNSGLQMAVRCRF